MSSTKDLAYLTAATPRSMIFSLVELNLCLMCWSDVPIPVWILGLFAYFSASAATLISFSTDLESAQTEAFFTILEISSTEVKSPGLEIGKPASIMSTPNWSSRSAITNFCSVFSLHPGTCSPSLRVVSKICTFLVLIFGASRGCKLRYFEGK